MTTNLPAHRSRWAALGAAFAVSLGAGGLGLASAAEPATPSAYVPIEPCRLADTRSASNIGPVAAPIGADTAVTYDGWGDVAGDCNLPTGTTALQLNVTAVGASQLTNVRLYPTGSALPATSSLNPAPGAAPTPNAVTVTLDGAGRFDVYNRFGHVDVLIDVAGYYQALDGGHDHDERYYTEAETDTKIASAVAAVETGVPSGSVYTKAETDALVADAIAAATPGEQTVVIPPHAFVASYGADVELKTDSFGTYPVAGTTPFAIDAPLVLPVGATITSVSYYANDFVAGQIEFNLSKAALNSPSSSVVPGTVVSTNIAGMSATVADLAIVVPADGGLTISAWSSAWVNGSHDLTIKGAKVTYTLP